MAVVLPTLRGTKPAQVEAALGRFRDRKKELRGAQVDLGERALKAAPSKWRGSDLPVLSHPSWLFSEPRPLEAVRIEFLDASKTEVQRAEWKVLKGLSLSGPVSYSEAICLANPNTAYFNGTVYRPREVVNVDAGVTIKFEVGKYFDYLDSGEVLAYEATSNRGLAKLRSRYRDPFDLSNRATSLGILTLTVVRRGAGATFLMHRRSGSFVVGDALYHVVPAGEFAPSDISVAAVRNDFTLWRNIMREFAEELLGEEDAQGHGGKKIDYEGTEPYKSLTAALLAGSLSVKTLGLVLDPLTLKPELLTVAVFDGVVFDRIFRNMVSKTTEGTIIPDIVFGEAEVKDYTSNRAVRLGARALLHLAWTHRSELYL